MIAIEYSVGLCEQKFNQAVVSMDGGCGLHCTFDDEVFNWAGRKDLDDTFFGDILFDEKHPFDL